ncbi:ATPase [Metamycoplasma cloacale]|uniref:ATP-dependent Clp protease ATP-binding subunit n=1 Tax=Metamycoplasma cloacale TaxID=92401 RepID=A0A2Z4LN52_9BACT|nr:AAA family ATPase [Metamycoplasma cloacale]AWX42677.1 ATP-dependent Clp protease ATP-binding subunit [Metamycoplasma cloacale]VEU79511.1 ATPase [Metamycoplasma cloacale]
MQASYTPNLSGKEMLEQFGRNLTSLASQNKLEPVINRDDEIRSLVRILSRKTKNNPVLVGEPGVGKTAIVEGLARKIVEGQVSENLKNKQIIELDLPSILAGTEFRGQFEERLKKIVNEVVKSDGEIILFIDEIHMLVGAGSTGKNDMDAANILKPLMARGQLHLIGATTLDEYREHIEQDPALERRMQKVYIAEPSVEDTITILRGIKERYETFHEVKIEDEALVAAANLSARYISDRFLPDKAIDLIDEAASNIKTEMNYIPEPLEKIKLQIAKLEIEKVALKDEEKLSTKSKERLSEIDSELNILKEKEKNLELRWKEEKEDIQKFSSIKENLDDLKNKLILMQNEGKYEQASKIKYFLIPELEKNLTEYEVKLNSRKNRLIKETVDAEEVANIVSKWSRIPVTKLLESQRHKILNLEESLNLRVKGQTEAIHQVSQAIIRAKANINDPNRPIGSFMFLGPTGVGKTELSKALAEALFDDENHIVRLDMSEYMEKYSSTRLIGSAPGYVDSQKGGQLTEKIRQNPYSIVLFDEIEKAHPDILNLLLQILDNGQITDARGKIINFRNTIIIMTSNIGSTEILQNNFSSSKMKSMLALKFKPEFINRIDEIIPFNSLNINIIEEITKLELNKLIKRIADNQNINVQINEDVLKYIAKSAHDPAFGARPIKRFIQKEIEAKLAIKIIEEEFKENQIVYLYMNNNSIEISTSPTSVN